MQPKQPKRDLSIKIDWEGMWSSTRDHWQLYCYIVPIITIIAGIYAWSLIDLYTSRIKLAPELNDQSWQTASSVLALVIEPNDISKEGGIYPTLYPDLMQSLKFRVSLLPITIHRPGQKDTSYYEYLLNERKHTWWERLQQGENTHQPAPIDTFRVSGVQSIAIGAIMQYVNCVVDPKNYLITISVKDQDPEVAAQVADSVSHRLQDYLIDYRSAKARQEYNYMKKMVQQARVEYEKARKVYVDFSDANRDLISEHSLSKQRMLEEEMQLQYENYSKLSTEQIKAEAKIQEATPSFTTLQSATVPLTPSEPKRAVIILISAFAATVLTSLIIWYREGDLYRLIMGGYKNKRN